MNCPVCPRRDVPANALSCPNCGADLTPLRRLDELADRFFNQGLALFEKGEYNQALEKMIVAYEFSREPEQVRVVIGKILWHLGRPREALAQWREVLARNPHHEEAKQLIEVTAGAFSAVSKTWMSFVLYGIVLIAFLSLAILHTSYRRNHSYSNTEFETAGKSLNKLKGAPQPPGRVPDVLSKLAEELRTRRELRVDQQSNGIRVIFNEGLFQPGSDQLTVQARSQLSSVVGLVGQQDGPCRIVVEGMADSSSPAAGGRWSDNWMLGFSRARSAMEFMRQLPGASKIAWYTTSSGHTHAPFPNDTEENRRKNRTVVLEVALDTSAAPL